MSKMYEPWFNPQVMDLSHETQENIQPTERGL